MSENVIVLSIGVDETRQTTINWRQLYAITSPVMYDPTGEMYDPYSLGLFPLNVILDETNTIRYQEIHFNEFEIRAKLSELSDPLVKIQHTPMKNTEQTTGFYPVSAVIRAGDPLIPAELKLIWETDTTSGELPLTNSMGNEYTADLPGQVYGTTVRYYLRAESISGQISYHPNRAPGLQHSFKVLLDTSAPVINHKPLTRWRSDLWSPGVVADITDDLELASVVLEYRVNDGLLAQVPMTQSESGNWKAWFTQPATTGDLVSYRIMAVDTSGAQNIGLQPSSGFFELEIIDPITALVLDLDSDQVSGAELRDHLLSLGLEVEFSTQWPDSLDHYRSLWLAIGVDESANLLSLERSMVLEAFMKTGNPIYLECGNCWRNPGRFNSINLFNTRADGPDQPLSDVISGLEDTLGHGLVIDYDADGGIVNQMVPVSRSDVIFQNSSPQFNTAIVSSSGKGRTIASTFELGHINSELDSTAGRRLVERYADFLGLIDLANCSEPGLSIDMPSDHFQSGDLFSVGVTLCNPTFRQYSELPLFVILDIEGVLYFWPTYSEFDYLPINLVPGEQQITVVDAFNWPAEAGSGSATWYAGMTDSTVSELFGTVDSVAFSW